jgi:acyl transferase domain-containing protein
MLEIVRTEVAAVLGLASADAVDPESTFVDLGFTSLAAVELMDRLERATGLVLAPTLGFDYPTPAAAAAYLEHELKGEEEVSAPEPAATSEEEIAIVGIGCRYPGGVEGPDDLWRLVDAETDAVSRFPEDRGWDLDSLYHPAPEHPGTTYAREGGFINSATEFDPAFFGISPREALAMDPQQRLLLETSWEALENAGVAPPSLRGSATGVFAGVATHDYLAANANQLPEALEPLFGLGNAGSVASGRVAYTLGLEGPAVTVDTACSSSLVAIHLACQSLRLGECSLALAGGVTVMASPSIFIQSSRQRLLSPGARCRSFAAGADGAGWAEGVGLVVLQPHSEATRLGREVLAIVRGSAINQDGASNGLAAPSSRAQERVIRQALANAGVAAAEVDAVEGHGTGTALGDPIEARALLATYGRARPRERPLRLGSLKSNIGHSQAAAGVGGVIKVAMAMRHERLPRTLHVDEPSPHVDWSCGSVALLTDALPWPRGEQPRRAGVSAFAVSGTNAHLILEEPASSGDEATTDTDTLPVPWLLSAKSEPALRRQAERLADHLRRSPGLSRHDVGHSLAERVGLERRAAVVGADDAGLREGLEAVTRSEPTPRTVRGTVAPRDSIAFVLPGHGCQWAGMAKELLRTSAVFAEQVGACDAAFHLHTGWSLEALLRGEGEGPPLDRVDVVQPVLFTVTVGLAQLWRSLGVEPSFLVGHSLGEVSAAHLAGVLSLEDAAQLVSARVQALTEISNRGGMGLVGLTATATETRIERFGGALNIAAVNGPSATVVSGERESLAELLRECEEDGTWVRRIPVDYASHSPQVEAIREPFLGALASIEPGTAAVPLVSTVTGAPIEGTELEPGYWHRNLRQTVRFEAAIRTLALRGCRTFIEVSPHPILTMAVEETLEAAGVEGGLAIGTLRRDDGGPDRFLTSAAEAYVNGVGVEWDGFTAGRRVQLPTYPFERTRFWIAAPVPAAAKAGQPIIDDNSTGHGAQESMLDQATAPRREEVASEIVRRQAAAILGYADPQQVDPGRSLFDLGLDSLGAVEMRTRIEAETGRRVPVSVFLDDPTVSGLGRYLAGREPIAAFCPEVPDGGPATTFAEPLRAARDAETVLELTRGLIEASRLQPSFTSSADLPRRQRALRISEGPALPRLVCIPSFLPGSGPQQFARLAAAFDRTRPIAAVRLPGLEAGEAAPADWEAAVAVIIEAALEEAGSDPFVLTGYSAGGALAHAVAERLEQESTAPAGLVLIDTYQAHGESSVDTFAAAMLQILERAHVAIPLEDAGLLAMAAYLRLLEEWKPAPVATPSLLLKASTALGSGGRWHLADEVREVGSDHFSLIEGKAPATAAAMQEWIKSNRPERVA